MHRFILYIFLVPYGYMSIRCIVSSERVFKYKKVLQAEVVACDERASSVFIQENLLQYLKSSSLLIVFFLSKLEQTYNLCLEEEILSKS